MALGSKAKWTCAGIAFVGLVFLAGCGEEEVVQVSNPSPITVELRTAAVDIPAGHTVVLRATVQAQTTGTLTHEWAATGGEFRTTSPDSAVWTAPDDPGLYRVSLVVSDGSAVGLGKIDVPVASYVPEDSPYYVGKSACALCHNGGVGGDEFAAWSASAHAGAWGSLEEIGQDDNASCAGCHSVGSYGLNADGALNNGGYDELAVDRLRGVQCENCHGAGSEHPDVDFASVETTKDAALCGDCHNGTHHPTFDEWTASPHNVVTASAATRAACAKCHNGLYTGTYLNDPEAFVPPAANPTEFIPITCAGCHDPHGNENPASLRNASVTDRALPNAVLVEAAGAGRLCMACHNGRRSSDDVDAQIEEGSAHLGPHHSVQGDMLAGVNAYERIDSTFAWSSSLHILAEDACVTCHTHPHEGDPESGIASFTGHSFLPTVEACASCHGDLDDFEEILAKADYDGDATIEGVQLEVDGLLDILEEAIIDASTSEEAADSLRADFEGKMGDPLLTTVDQRKAAYNWAFVAFDASRGVHNATYAIQLLQRSALFLSPGALPERATLLEAE